MHHSIKHTLLLCATAALGGTLSVNAFAQNAEPKSPEGATAPAEKSPSATATTPDAPKAPSKDSPTDLLGERFTSAAGGISFRAPADAKRHKPVAMGKTIVQYVNAEERWALLVSRLMFDKPGKLFAEDNPATPNVDESKTDPGVVDRTVREMLMTNASTQVLRKDFMNVGRQDAGLLITRLTEGGQTWLRQQAFIQATDNLFYSFDLRTPSTWTPADKDGDEDPTEQAAVEVFRAILDSVSLVDQGNITRDVEERLYRTRSLFVTLPSRMQQAVLPEQYFRIVRAGKDVGWLFVTEEVGERNNEPGVYVANLSQVTSKEGRKDSVASEMFVTRTRSKEAWVTIAVVDNGQTRDHASEFGTSERKNQMVRDANIEVDPNDTKQPKMRISERYTLNVTQSSKAGATPPINRDLPPYYLPQAVSQMIPRLVPLNEPKGYAFAVWITAERELVYRFIDVEAERQVTFAGKPQRVIPVRDRVGLEGEPTVHYFTPEGKYLGNESSADQIALVATDAQTLTQLYPDARIARPRVLDDPREQKLHAGQ